MPTGLQHVDTMARVDQVEQLQEAFEGVHSRRVSVRLEGSPVERVRVELLDRMLRGELDVDDPAVAARLRADSPELLRALEERGFDTASLAVRMSGGGDGAAESWGAALRSEGAANVLRSLLGSKGGALDGREGQDQRDANDSGADRPTQDDRRSRQDNRRDSR